MQSHHSFVIGTESDQRNLVSAARWSQNQGKTHHETPHRWPQPDERASAGHRRRSSSPTWLVWLGCDCCYAAPLVADSYDRNGFGADVVILLVLLWGERKKKVFLSFPPVFHPSSRATTTSHCRSCTCRWIRFTNVASRLYEVAVFAVLRS